MFLLASGCAPAPFPTADPLPSLQALVVERPLSLVPLDPALWACAVLQPDLALIIQDTAARIPQAEAAIPPANFSLSLGLTDSPALFVLPLTDEEITVIINLKNLLERVRTEELYALFSGEIRDWKEVGGPDREVQVWIYPEMDPLRTFFDQALGLEGTSNSQAFLAPGPAEMIEAVSSETGAIGYLPSAWLSSQVKTLELDRTLANRLRQPVLVQTQEEPAGALRTFVGCLQDGPGQQVIRENYTR